MRFKVIAGRHIGPNPDYKWNSDKGLYIGPNGEQSLSMPDMFYGPGEVGGLFFESDVDMVRVHGKEKFAYADEAAMQEAATAQEERIAESGFDEERRPKLETVRGVSVTPAGCVTNGIQVSTSGPNGTTVSGAMTENSIPRTAEEKQSNKKDGTEVETASGRKKYTPEDSDETEEELPEDLDGLTIPELRALAQKREIEIPSHALKDEIVDTIKKSEKARAGSKRRTGTR